CARRVASLILESDFEQPRQELFLKAIRNAERAAESGKADFQAEVHCYAWCDTYQKAVAVTADAAALAAAGFAHITSLHMDAEMALSAANAASTAITFANRYSEASTNGWSRADSNAAIRRDFEILRTIPLVDKRENATVSPAVFALHVGFDFDVGLGRSTLIKVIQKVDQRLIDHLRNFPEEVYGMDPRLFEELI